MQTPTNKTQAPEPPKPSTPNPDTLNLNPHTVDIPLLAGQVPAQAVLEASQELQIADDWL